MSRKSKAAFIGFVAVAALVGGTAAWSADGGFTYYDFSCPKMGIERHKESLTTTAKLGDQKLVIKYVCDGRSCFSLQRPSDPKDGGLRFRHIYFPRGRTEFIYASAIWFAEEDAPRITDSKVVPLVTCKPQ